MNLPILHSLEATRASPLLLGTTVGVIMLCAVGVGLVTGVIPGVGAKSAPEPIALPVTADHVRASGQCASCGIVVLIRTFEIHSDLSPMKAAAGAAPGSIVVEHTNRARPGTVPDDAESLPEQLAAQLASQFSFERTPKKRYVYRVTIQMEDGSYRTLSQNTAPQFSPGNRVRLVQGALSVRD